MNIESIESLVSIIQSYGILGPIVFIFLFLIAPYLLIPAVLIAVLAGMIWEIKGFIYLMVAANLSATLEFFIARKIANKKVKTYLMKKNIQLPELTSRGEFLTVFIVRLIPNIAWNFQNFVFGLSPISFKNYFFGTFLGIIPFAFVVVFMGSEFLNLLENHNLLLFLFFYFNNVDWIFCHFKTL